MPSSAGSLPASEHLSITQVLGEPLRLTVVREP